MKKDHKILVFPSKLQEKVKELILNAPRSLTYVDMEEATGVSRAWISQLVKDKIDHPSVGRLEALYEYLSNKKIMF